MLPTEGSWSERRGSLLLKAVHRRGRADTSQGSTRLGGTVMGTAYSLHRLSNFSCSQAGNWMHSSSSQQPAKDLLRAASPPCRLSAERYFCVPYVRAVQNLQAAFLFRRPAPGDWGSVSLVSKGSRSSL